MRIFERERTKMRSEALKKAQQKYAEEKVTRVNVNFYPTDQELLDRITEVVPSKYPSKQGYIKELIRADMIKEKNNEN
jgi:metal-responsive CopG/Arc/MetJ family transcriptional regulator